MKRSFAICLALLACAALAWAGGGTSVVMVGGGVPVSGTGDLLVFWDCGDTAGSQTALNTHQESSTVTSTNSDFSATGYSGSGHSVYIDADAVASFACTDGTSINLDKGQIEFEYKRRSGADAYGVFFQLGSGANDFVLRAYSDVTDYIQFRYHSNRVQYDVGATTDFPLNTWVTIKLVWDNTAGAGEKHSLYVNGTEYTGTFVSGSALGTKPTISSAVMHLGDDGTGTYNVMGEIDDFKIYSKPQ